jgi:hypothetical protein
MATAVTAPRRSSALTLTAAASLANMSSAERRNITYQAPIGCVDLAAFDEDGEPYDIRACNSCLPWHAEVVRDDDGEIFVREWHAVECPDFEELIKRD